MEENQYIVEYKCLSTHGGAGYATGSYWDGDDIICGACGERIKNPTPTGGTWVYEKGLLGWLFGKGHWEPKWPSWIGRKQEKTDETI